MNVKFSNDMKSYRDYVTHPEDRKAMRKFCKEYSADIAEEAVNRHKLLEHYPSALAYNQVFGSTDNRIELKRGSRDKEPLILKVRVTRAYRKFFHAYCDDMNDTYIRTKEWIGQFDAVTDIYVIEVNKHIYN